MTYDEFIAECKTMEEVILNLDKVGLKLSDSDMFRYSDFHTGDYWDKKLAERELKLAA